MASNTGKAPTASSSKAPAVKKTPPAKKPAAAKQTKPASMITCAHCRLEYQVASQALDDRQHAAMENIAPTEDVQIKFELGNIEVLQKKAGHRCIITFLKKDISWEYHDVAAKLPNGDRFLHVGVRPSSAPTVDFRSNAANAQENARGVELAKSYPLAKLANISRLRLLLEESMEYWSANQGAQLHKDLEVRGGQIKAIMTGASSADPTSRIAQELQGDIRFLNFESATEEKQLGALKGCRIEVCHVPGHEASRQAIVQIWPTKPPSGEQVNARDYDFDKKIGQQYFMYAPKTFKVDPRPADGKEDKAVPEEHSVMRPHQIYGNKRFTRLWKVTIVKNKMGLDAPLVGLVQNAFDGPESTEGFIGEEEDDVEFEPDFMDVLRDRAKVSNWDTQGQIDNEEKILKDFAVDCKILRPQVPLVRFFMMEQCNEQENRLDAMANATLPVTMQQGLNASQQKAVLTALKNKFSLIWGPPGTGKSQTLASLVKYLTVHRPLPEKVLVCASTNVAVNEALAKAFNTWQPPAGGADKYAKLPYMRVYSREAIKTQYSQSDPALLDPCHIENHCIRLAKGDPEFRPFLKAAAEAKTTGMISGKESYVEYDEMRTRLARQAMDTYVHVVYCTLTASRSPLVYEPDHKLDDRFKPKYIFPATTIIVDERSTVIRPFIMIPVIVFFKVQRVVQAGDDRQLGPFLLTKEAKEHFNKSSFNQLMQKGWPCTQLNVQYRTYQEMFGHTQRVIYGDVVIHSARSLHQGRTPFGQTLAAALPISFHQGRNRYALPSIKHLINVDGAQESDGTSSHNAAEADAVSNLVLAIKRAGFADEDIAVLAGYTAQTKSLTRIAHDNGWAGVKVHTIDTSQGSEARILVISLVSTTGEPSFMGQKSRSNVATSREQEALFFVGKWAFWRPMTKGPGGFMGKILNDCDKHASEISAHSFVQYPLGDSMSAPRLPPPPAPRVRLPPPPPAPTRPAEGAQASSAPAGPLGPAPNAPPPAAGPTPAPGAHQQPSPQGPALPTSASAGPSIPKPRGDSEQVASDRATAEALQESLNAEEPVQEQLPEEEEPEVEGKGKGKAAVIRPEGSWAEDVEVEERLEGVESRLAVLEQGLRDTHREIMDQANVQFSRAEMEVEGEKRELQDQRRELLELLDRRRRGI